MDNITNALQKAYSICGLYNNIGVSISGGADSDIMLDLLLKVAPKEKFTFYFFDTGIEYEATKRHLDYLEKRYDIVIERHKAIVPVPLGCQRYGLPFISKYVSQQIGRLQNHNFDWKDGTYEEMVEKYPRCKGALRWFNNNNNKTNNPEKSQFNIYRHKWLREFLIDNPPTFKISDKCCEGAKKNNAHQLEKERNFDLCCIGVRKAEGGIRSAIKSCFDEREKGKVKHFRPIFWLTNEDKKIYDEKYNIIHSDCYRVYGMKRTGCARCPFGSSNIEEYSTMLFEPKLYQATENIFGKAYDYRMQYENYKKQRNHEIYKIKEQ